jgi:hypothetical protein
LTQIGIDDSYAPLEQPGVLLLCSGDTGFYVNESKNMRQQLDRMLSNENWRKLEPDNIKYIPNDGELSVKYGLKSAIAQRELPFMNCRLLMFDSELPGRSE